MTVIATHAEDSPGYCLNCRSKFLGDLQWLTTAGVENREARIRRFFAFFPGFDFDNVAFSVQYPDHPNPALVSQVIDAHILKSLDGPGSQAPESFPGKTLGRAALRRPDDPLHRSPDGA